MAGEHASKGTLQPEGACRINETIIAYSSYLSIAICKWFDFLVATMRTSGWEPEKQELPRRQKPAGEQPRGATVATQVAEGSTTVAISRYMHRALASCMCRGVRHSGSNNLGLPTRITAVIAREVATFSLFRL